jgi:hypothetical protein
MHPNKQKEETKAWKGGHSNYRGGARKQLQLLQRSPW